jgi:HK97 gp10 family phage protein
MAVVSGRDKVFSRWDGDEVKKRAEKCIGKSSFEIGFAVEGQAKELSPYDTGRLKGSIHTVSGMGQKTNPKNDAREISKPDKAFETHVGTTVEYAPYQEYGTVKTNAQPFLRPALDMVRGKAPQIVMREGKATFGEYLNPKQPSERALMEDMGITE